MYTKFYGFSQKPFNVTPDPKFLFFTDSNREALASMIYGITERKGFIAITGEVGTGKTTLVHHLLQILDKKTKTVFIYQTHFSFAGLLRNILLELEIELDGNDVTSYIRQLSDYLIQRLVVDENLAILIDEAQNLSKEVLEDLRMLSNLETPNFKLIQIVFLGQPEFDANLNSPDLRQLKQRIGIRRQLRALTDLETRLYIDHRLRIAGGQSAEVFTPGALALIARYSEGIPRNINMICDNAFLIGYSVSKKKIDEKIISEVLNDLGMVDSAGGSPQPMEPNTAPEVQAVPEPPVPSAEEEASGVSPETQESGQPPTIPGPSILESRQRMVISAVRPQSAQSRISKRPGRAWASIAVLAGLGLIIFFAKDHIYHAVHSWLAKSVTGEALTPAPAPFVKVPVKANPDPAGPPAGKKVDAPPATGPAAAPAPEGKAGRTQSPGPESSSPFAKSPGETNPEQAKAVEKKADTPPVKVPPAPPGPGEKAGSFPSPKPVSAVAAPRPKPQTNRRIISVKEGDTIYGLSRKYLNLSNITLMDLILELNPAITDPNLIRVNQRVELPEISPESLLIQSADGTHKIFLGTFLSPDAAGDFKGIPLLRKKEIEVIPRNISREETWYRLVTGPFPSREEGLQAIRELKEKGLLPALSKTGKAQGA